MEKDTMASISSEKNVSVESLTSFNKLSDELKPGQILKIPKKSISSHGDPNVSDIANLAASNN